MFTRTLSRGLMSIALACLTLVALILLVAQPPARAGGPAALINCSGSIQACIDAANEGDTILIAAGRYTESLTLSKAVSLTGVSSDTTIIHAVAGQRVLTVTGASISNSVVISGLTFMGGDATNGLGTGVFPIATPLSGFPTPTRVPQMRAQSTPQPSTRRNPVLTSDPRLPAAWRTRQFTEDFDPARDGVGGGLLITNSAQPQLQATRVISNLAGYGGGLYVYGSKPLRLSQMDVLSNVAVIGGGLYAHAPITLYQSVVAGNLALSVGGGAHVSGTLTLLSSHVTRNQGGGLDIEGSLTAQQTHVSFNEHSNMQNVFDRGSAINHSNGELTLNGVVIEGNSGYGISPCYGSTVASSNSTVLISNTRFSRNSAGYVKSLMLYNSSGQLVNSLFAQNSSNCVQIETYVFGNVQIRNTDFVGSGGAIYFQAGTLAVTNTLIANYGIGIDGYSAGATEDYNLFFNNGTNTINVITGAHSLVGDPRFVNPLHDDYRLQIGSAAIDRGVDAGVYTDLDGNSRPSGAGFDIGAYEYIGGLAAGTRYVATTGSDDGNDCLNSLTPCATIQRAVDVATEDDEIHIAAGTYTDLNVRPRNDITKTGVVTQVVYLNKSLTIRGGYTTTNWIVANPLSNPTVLDPQAQGRALYVTGSVSPTIEGLRLTHGNSQAAIDNSTCMSWQDCETVGAAVYVWRANLTLSDSQIDNNHYGRFDGGSIYVNSGHAVLNHNTVISNVNGGGIALMNSSGTISGNVIMSNSVNGDGGGVLINFSTATLINNSIINNTADYVCGGGVCVGNGQAEISNNIIRGNSIQAGTGGGVNIFSSTATLQGNLIEDNHAGNILHVDGGGVSLEYNSSAKITGNIIRHNFATANGGKGGGVLVYANSQADLIGNIIAGNLSEQGGGVDVDRYSSATLINNLINQNAGASAVYVGGSIVQAMHNTLADTGNSLGLYITDYAGTASKVALTNTIFASHTIGVSLTQGHTVTLDSTVWHGTPITLAQAASATITSRNSFYGDPLFVDPYNGNYHLRSGSIAIDHGIDARVYTDLDGHARPNGAGFDIGAYEFIQVPINGTRYVATTGDDTSNVCLDSAIPCATLQHAIDVANDGEQVVIASGLYTQSTTLGKAVSVTGVNSATTILHAVAGQRVLTVTGSPISNSVVISGLTFMGGTADSGGGIYSDVPLNVRNTRFISNTAGLGNGGGLFTNDVLTITNSTFIGNTGVPAGGLRARGTHVTIADTDFIENTGGAMILAQNLAPSEVHISGGRFERNSAGGLIVNGSLEMTSTSIVSNTGGNGVNVWRGTARLSNVRFENNSCTAGLNCDAGGLYFYGDQGPSQPYAALTLTNTAFISNSPGGVYASHSSLVLVANGYFERNSTPNYGGGLWSYDSPVTLIDTRFQSNTAAFAGGGYFAISPTLVSNTIFISNSAQLNGGGAFFGEAEIYDSRFEGNTSNESGGGLLASGLRLNNTDVIDNQSRCQSRALGCGGGGAYAFDDATIVKSHFEDNAVMNNGSGGGLFASRAVTMSNVYLINNTVQQSGGGAYITGLANIDHSRFESNSAQFTGGGLYADYTMTLTNTDFISNLAGSGGGLFTNRTLWVTGGRFIGNRCRGITCGGGAMLVGSTPAIYANLIVMNSQFIGNTATTTDSIGGAVYYGSSGAVHVVNTLFARNVAQKYGAALFLNWGTVANLDYLTVAGESLNPIAALTVFGNMPVAINNSIIVSHAIGIQNLAGGVLASNSLFFGNSTNTTGAIGGGPSFVGDPKFVDPARDNYHLQFGSAAIDRGINVGVYTDLDDHPRPIGPGFDIGAYEYGGTTHWRYLPLIRK